MPGRKKQELLAEEFGISRIKVRKILITTGELRYPLTDQIEKLLAAGMKIDTVAERLKISKSTANSLIPYQKGVYKLSEVSAAAERTALYRERKASIATLNSAINDGSMDEQSVALWKAIIAFEGYPFTTSGRGSRPGIKFTYEVSRSAGSSGRHYKGVQVEGYGNELWITTLPDKVTTATDKVRKKKSISRSTVDLALKNALEQGGCVSGPKKLNVPGAGSYLYSLFLRFVVIQSSAPDQE